MDLIYFDNAATTPIYPEVIEAMHATMQEDFGNPSSVHAAGRSAKAKVESARKYIANQMGVLPKEIIFTSGGTEGDNTVMQAALHQLKIRHFISSPIEHHAVLHPLEHMAQQGHIKLDLVKILPNGLPDTDDLKRLLSSSDEKKMVSLMHVNNEVGTILDLEAVGNLCHEHNALFHTDTVQSIGHFYLDFGKLPVDFAVASAHKFHGPKGVGFLYIQKDTGLSGILLGGSQERGMRAGTEAVHNIVGMQAAFQISCQRMQADALYIKGLKSYCLAQLQAALPGTTFNGASGDIESSTYTIVNARLPMDEKKAQLLAFNLDLQGVCCSKGSACQSGSEGGSHVLQNLLTAEQNKVPSLRFSFSAHNTKKEIDKLVDILVDYVKS
jgi:cysteine desulfurase